MIARILLAAVATLSAAQPALAVERQPSSVAALQSAQAHGRSVLVDVAADWCPVCKSQEAKIERLTADRRFAKLLILRLDFDSQKAEWRALGANRQATLIGYKGRREVGRGPRQQAINRSPGFAARRFACPEFLH